VVAEKLTPPLIGSGAMSLTATRGATNQAAVTRAANVKERVAIGNACGCLSMVFMAASKGERIGKVEEFAGPNDRLS
jgi:hypothetical protein